MFLFTLYPIAVIAERGAIPNAPTQAPRLLKEGKMVKITWPLSRDESLIPIEEYEIETATLSTSLQWNPVTATPPCTLIQVRVDPSGMKEGWFKLSVAGLATVAIDFDASSRDVLSALEDVVDSVMQVTRCDETGHCPYGDRGGYSWRVFLDETLEIYDEALSSEAIWSGPGPMISTRKTSNFGAEICGAIACTAALADLSSSSPVAFRVTAINAAGKSQPGPPSQFARLTADDAKRPSRPLPPLFGGSASSGSVYFYASTSRTSYIERPSFFDVQYRTTNGTWLDAGRVDHVSTGWASFSLSDLEGGTKIETRSRGVSSDKLLTSEWSAPSFPVTIPQTTFGPPQNPPRLSAYGNDTLIVRWEYDQHLTVEDAQGLLFEVSVQEWGSSTWRVEADEIRAAQEPLEGAEDLDDVQTVRADDSTAFRLRLPGITGQTEALNRESSAAQLQKALEEVGLPRNFVSVTKRDGIWRLRFMDALKKAGAESFPLLLAENGFARIERERSAKGRRLVTVHEARVVVDNAPSWYRARVRTRRDDHFSDWSSSSEWIHVVGLSKSSSPPEKLAIVFEVMEESAHAWRCARRSDPDYVPGACDGGLAGGSNGGNGLVVVSAFDSSSYLKTRATYFESGTFSPPRGSVKIVSKLWGGGGGGCDSARGGGGAFIQVSSFTGTEDLVIVIGGGGGGASTTTAGLGGQNGGGDGGAGTEIGGAGGGGASEIRLSSGKLLALASGGGGAARGSDGSGGSRSGNGTTTTDDGVGSRGEVGGGGGGAIGGYGGRPANGGVGGTNVVSVSSRIVSRTKEQVGVPPRILNASHDTAWVSLLQGGEVQAANGAFSTDFRRHAVFSQSGIYQIENLKAATVYRLRVKPPALAASTPAIFETAPSPVDRWINMRSRQRPSPRRGHTLTRLGPDERLPRFLQNSVFLFGGKGPGYECDGPVGASFRFGSPTAGRDVEQCFLKPGASNELWRFDDGSWHLLQAASGPPARSRHVAVALGAKLYVWGGEGKDGKLLNDLWQLEIGPPQKHNFYGEPVVAPPLDVAYSSANGTSWDDNTCIIDFHFVLDRTTSHSISLFGPRIGSLVEHSDEIQVSGRDLRTDLSARFKGINPYGQLWTLRIRNDEQVAKDPVNWQLEVVVEPCDPDFTWRNVSTDERPPPMRDAIGVAVNASLFIVGTREQSGVMWRYESNIWTRLVSTQPMPADGFLGKTVALTPFGLFSFGGYRVAIPHTGTSRLEPPILSHISDLRDPRWRRTEENSLPHARYRHDGQRRLFESALNAASSPRAREYASLAYVTEATSRGQQKIPSLLLFGGHDLASDLDDSWIFSLANTSLQNSTKSRNDDCAFRFRRGGARDKWDATCGSRTPEAESKPCTIFDLLVQAYCLGQYQSINHFPY